MKAFSFQTILKNFGKQLSSLASQMPWCNLRFNLGSMSVLSRVNPLFSRTSLGTSRRASHFAAILTILFTIGVGSVWGAYDVPANGKVITLSTKVNNEGRFNVEASGVYHFRLGGGYSWSDGNGIKTQSNQCGVIFYLDASTEIEVGIKHTESKNAHDVTVHVYSIPESEYKQFDDNKAGAAESDRTFSTGPSTSSDDSFTISVAAESTTFTGTKTLDAGYYAVVPVGAQSNTYFNSIKFTSGGVTKPTFSPATGSSLVKSTGTVTLTSSGNTVYYKWSQTDNQYASGAGATLADAADGSGTSPVNATAPSTAGTWYLYAVAKNGGDYSGVVKATYTITNPTHMLTWNLDGGTATGGTAAGAVAEGATLTAPTVTKVGYDFAGWSPSVPTTMPAADATYTATWTKVYASGTYQFDGHLTVGTSPSYTVSTTASDYAAKRADNIFFSATNIQFEGTDGTPQGDGDNYKGWKVKASTTIKFNVEDNSDVEVSIGSIGGGTCTITYTDQSSVVHNNTAISAGSNVTYKVKAGTMVTISMAPSSGKSITLKRIAINGASSCTAPNLSYATTTITKTFGDAAFTNALTNTNSVEVAYSSTNKNVATVADNGQVTIKGAGETTITASSAEQTVSGTLYCEAEASYTLTVNKANISPTLTYSNTSLDIDGTANPTINGNTGNGAVTYSSSNTDVATVDSNTGVVTAKTEGTTTITATIDATANYNGGTATATITVNAAPEPETYSITYNLGPEGWKDGYTPASTYTAGTEHVLPTIDNLTNENYGTFQGWYENNTFTGEAVTSIPTDATGDKTYYAKWVYDIQFFEVVDEATDVENKEFNKPLTGASYPTTYTYGVGLTLPELPAKDGYTADGWYSQWCVYYQETNGLGWVDACKLTALDNNAYGNVNFAVKYTAITYTLTWDVNGGNALTGEYTSGTVAYGSTITKPADPTRTGYTFAGWHNGTSIVTPAATMPAANTTYTATWTAKTTTITINANTANHGSTTPGNVTATYGSALPSFTAAAGASGYSLIGYFTAATSGTKVINADGTLVASTDYTDGSGKWKSEDATLTLFAQYEKEVSCTGDPTALVSGTLYQVSDMASACLGEITSTGQYFYGLSSNGKFYINGTTNSNNASTGTVEIKTASNTIDKINFTGIAWFKDAGTNTCRSIKFVVPSAGTLTIYGKTSSGDGNVVIKTESSGNTTVIANSVNAYASGSTTVSAGTYYVLSDGGSAAIVGLKFVESACSTPAVPTGFTAGSITSTGATFSITDGGDAASYDIYYSTSSDAPTASTAATTTSTEKTKEVTGLTASTTYYAWVRSVCDASNKSAWVALTSPTAKFTTSAAAASQTALVINTLYKVPGMIPSGESLTSSDQFFDGLSANTKFELIGSGSGSTTPKVNNNSSNDKTIDGITFDDGSMWFKGSASLTSNVPTTFGLSFIVPEGGGKLYLYFSGESTNIKLAKSGSEGSKPTLTDGYAAVDVTAGTYYLYGTGTSSPYSFYGMKLCSTYSVSITTNNTTKTSGETGSTAAVNGKAYTATFTANTDYTLPSDVTVSIGGAAQTKGTGYTWEISDGTGTLTVPAAKVTGAISITVTGCADAPSTFTVSATVNPAGYGTLSASSITDVASGTAISTSSNVLTVTGKTPITATPASATDEYTYTFSNWTKSDGTALPSTVTSNLTATANFTRTPKNYTLSWVTDGDELTGEYTSGSVAYGTTIVQPNTPTKSGYTFAGWDPEVAATMPAETTTYTAQWTEDECTPTTLFSMVVADSGSDGNVARQGGTLSLTTSDHLSTLIGGTATIKNAYSSAGNAHKMVGSENSERHLRFSYDTHYLIITLDQALAEGDTITYTGYSSSSSIQISFTTSETRSTTPATSNKTYTIPAGSGLIGATTLYVWRSTNNTTYIKSLTITRPCDESGETCKTPNITNIASTTNMTTAETKSLNVTLGNEDALTGTVSYAWTNADGSAIAAAAKATGTTTARLTLAEPEAGTYTFMCTVTNDCGGGDSQSATSAVFTVVVTADPDPDPEPELVPQVGTFTGAGTSGMVNLYWTMPTKPVTTTVDIASATLSTAEGQTNSSTITKENTNEIKVEYSTDDTWQTAGVKIPLATSQTNVESITFEYKSFSNQSVDLIPFLYDGTTRWVESNFTKLTPTEWTSHTSVITQEVWNNSNIYSTDKTILSVNFYANPGTATNDKFYIRNIVLNQGTQVAAEGLIIVRKEGSNPTSPTDGKQVYDGDGIAATCTDDGLENGTTYHYAAYAHDGQDNYSEPLYWQYTYTEGLNTYAPDDTDFPNPERGFYEQVQWNANKGYEAVIGDSYFNDARAANRSLILRIYYLDTDELRQNYQLPEDFIEMFNADMDKFRTNGMKCILRFAYDENSSDGYQDALPETWATHLAQLKTHLENNADVIYVVQAGFLGVWGEWYYSSLGTGNDEIELSIKNTLIDQLLAAVPANRCVQLRTPLFKKEYLASTDTLTPETAYKGTAQARLGHHNDAFLNGEYNQGTYENRTADMAYIAQECLYVPIGGETNLNDGESSTYDTWCKGSIAEAEMAQLHYSYLNHSYSQYVTNQWKAEGSYARMSKYMGYRFELASASLPNKATAGTQMNVQLNIKNVGYAPLYNERHAYIVFKNNTNTYSIQLSSDPRTWAPNSAVTPINENIALPDDMVAGTYDMYLHLPDASASIADNPKYAVRFANQGIWEPETGYNKLNKQITITAACTVPTTTFTGTTYSIGGSLDLSTLIGNEQGEGAITYEITSGSGASINGSMFDATQSGAVTITATQAADETYCQKVMTATIVVSAPIDESGCSQYFTFVTKNSITNPTGQQGSKYLQLTDNYATATGLDATLGKVGIKDIATDQSKTTTLIDKEEIYFPNTSTYLKVEYMSKDLAAGDQITITTDQSSETEYIFTTAGTKCAENCITTSGQTYTIPVGSSLIGANTFYIWASTAQRYLKTITICRPVNDINITYSANGGTGNDVTIENNNIVANCTFTAPTDKEFSGWNTAEDGSGTAYAVGDEVTESTTLYAQWRCIEPKFTVSYSKTEYTKGETASALIVSVTAGNVTGYQWYSSTTNDRNNGNTIGDATSASYTPSTTSVGTTYYWCEIENTCTSVQTAMIAITVRANKNTPDVTWNNPTGVNYGGGNYSISATVNGEWDGTLTADMLTAPTGINLYNVRVQDNTISATFDVTTSFDKVANPTTIPFYLSLPETDAYYSLVSKGDVPYEACTTGGGSEYRIPVNQSFIKENEKYRWDTENVGWITLESGSSSIGSENRSYEDFSYRTNSNKKEVLIYSKIPQVKRIRIYVYGSNTTELSTISTGTEYNTYQKLSVAEYTFTNDVKTINKEENGIIEINLTTPLNADIYVQFKFSANARYYGVELETDGGGTLQPTLQWSGSLTNGTTIEKTQSDVNFTYTASLTGENSNTLGTITYSSSNPECATVNPTTGEVEITATGTETLTTTITATLAPSGCYKGATATYTIYVAGMSCDISAGTLALTEGAENKCSGESVTLSLTGYTAAGTTLQWYKGDEAINGATNATYTTTEPGAYSVLVTDNENTDCAKRSNTITITNISAEASVTNIVNTWYIKNGRLTPEIALWKLEEGTTFESVTASEGWADGTGFNSEAFSEKDGVVYLTGTPPKENTGEDKAYILTLNVIDVCKEAHAMTSSTITIVHQKNTDKHVLAFVVTGKKNGEFNEGITAAQTTSVNLYYTISQNFDVQATNIYSTDDEKALKEYYSQFDIICITDYPDSKNTGVNGKSYTDAMGSLIDIRPILTMEAWVSKYTNWNNKGVTGNPKSPTTRQYSMLLQCKDHEIFANTSLVSEIVDGETMYRVTMVDKNKEEYVTLDKVNENPHQEKKGYKYGSNPALQGFTYTSSMSSMLPIGIIDDGAGNNLQVGLERQHEIEARMMVIGVNSYAMERLTADGEKVIINALKYLMKKNAKDISDCSTYFVGGDETDPTAWSNENNWGPTKTLPNSSQEARILAPCVVSDYTAKVASVKIVTDGTYAPGYGVNGEGFPATGSLTIAPNGALVVKGRIQAATAPNYLETRNTDVEDLIVQSDDTGNGALIFNNAAGDTKATVAMYSKAYTNIDKDGKKKKHWQYCAIPIHEAPIPEFFWGAYTYLWEEPNGAWTRKRDGATLYEWQPIGVSYGAVMEEHPTYRFYGELTSTDEQSFDLTYTEGPYGGMNLIGNSWTAPINIAAFEDADFEGNFENVNFEGNITKEILIHNTGRREEVGSDYNYGTVLKTSETPGQWIAIPIGAPKVPGYDGVKVISSLQAFQINVTAASTLTLNYDRLVRSTKQEDLTTPMRAPSRKAQVATIVPKEVRMLKVRVADKKNHADIYIFDHDGFTPQYDNGWDARFGGIVDNYPSLSVLTQDGEMSMAAIPTIDGTTLGFSSGTDNEYMISFKYTGEETLYLNDMQLKKSTQINNVNQYYFTTDVNDMYNRFVISKESFDSPNISTGLANIVTDANGLQVTNPNQENLQVILIDAAGRMCSIYNTAEPMFKVELPATQGVYMINVKGETTNIVRKVVK